MNNILKVSLRQKAVYVPESALHAIAGKLNETTALLAANAAQLGYGFSEPLLRVLNQTTPTFHAEVLESLRELSGVDKNWTPLVKGWDTPTGESVIDHIITFFANVFRMPGTRLPCGYVIPPHTFPLERYNGCPFCGTPFEFGKIVHYKQGSQEKVLDLWTEADATAFLQDLLTSKTALDATQLNSLKLLLEALPFPEVIIPMKETRMAVIDSFIAKGQGERASMFFDSPTDVMRYLWYKHTGFMQIIAPQTIIRRKAKNGRHITHQLDESAHAKLSAKDALKLKYTRQECRMAAGWLNGLPMTPEKMCEIMHPKRGMWVRFIRALRLIEYSKRPGMEKLRVMLEMFINEQYQVWQGAVNYHRLRSDADSAMALLKQRPGLFARSLFANMLWFGKDTTTAAFAEVVDKVPSRLLLTLSMYAENYFDPNHQRSVKPLGGTSKTVPANRLLSLYTAEQREDMKKATDDLCLLAMKKRFAGMNSEAKTMYIDPALFNIPVSIGERSESIQDLPGAALTGTRFVIEGDTVRLFMQWGTGLPAQHMDMDLSCLIAYPGKMDRCSYSKLVARGCLHSGDIRTIPEKVGTAEYININLQQLAGAGAVYVIFTCNAYSVGDLTPNMVVGWMNSRYPMRISETTGVAYDPSCVQHKVRISSGLSKGLIFGVLEVAKREIVWLEMPFAGQIAQELNFENVHALLKKLSSRLTIGQLLKTKAEAQQLELIALEAADEAYTQQWAMNTAAVTQLLID